MLKLVICNKTQCMQTAIKHLSQKGAEQTSLNQHDKQAVMSRCSLLTSTAIQHTAMLHVQLLQQHTPLTAEAHSLQKLIQKVRDLQFAANSKVVCADHHTELQMSDTHPVHRWCPNFEISEQHCVQTLQWS